MFEVLNLSKVKNVVYFDGEKDIEVPERQILLGTLTGGSKWSQDKFLCIVTCDDALKPLREGDIISATLSFNMRENENGISLGYEGLWLEIPQAFSTLSIWKRRVKNRGYK